MPVYPPQLRGACGPGKSGSQSDPLYRVLTNNHLKSPLPDGAVQMYGIIPALNILTGGAWRPEFSELLDQGLDYSDIFQAFIKAAGACWIHRSSFPELVVIEASTAID